MEIADLHCDTITALDPAQWREGSGHISWRKLKEAGYGLQCVAVFQPYDRGDLYANFMRYADLLDESVEQNGDLVAKVTDARGIEKAVGEGKVALMLTIEEGGTMEGSLNKLHTLYRRGVRMMTLTWNFANELGYPNLDIATYRADRLFSLAHTDDRGLTPLGHETVAEMNR
ncbi:MAG: membrane dipeptidase, partial [Clostridia bacterium]|nr:membrane dipeptidase [Clostridia bacterium]